MTNYSWTTGNSGNWSTTTNWNGGTHYPGARLSTSDSATVGAPGTYTVTYNVTSDTISGLTVGAAGATLAIHASDTLNVSGLSSLTSGTIDVLNTNAILNTATLTSSSGSVIDVGNGGVINATGAAAPQINLGGLLESTAGFGTVSGAIGGSGTIDATGGTLDLTGNVVSNSLKLETDSTASSALELNGAVASGTQFSFLNSGGVYSGKLILGTGALTSFENNATISGMHVLSGGSGAPSGDVIDILGLASGSVASGQIVNGNTLELLNGSGGVLAHFLLGSALSSQSFAPLAITNAPSSSSPYVNWGSDGAGGTAVSLSSTVCYAAGTLVLTERGEIAVECLRAGDRAVVLEGDEHALHPVRWVGHRHLDLAAHPRPETVAPIRVRAGAIADSLPRRDLLLSPDHAIYLDGKLIAARQLVNGTSIVQESGWSSVDYYHVELDRHAILLAEGLAAESYLDTGNRGFFANSAAPLILHPDLSEDRSAQSREAGACAPFAVDEDTVHPIWRRLAERAAALGLRAPETASTTEPALRIIAKGRTIKPIYERDGLYIFPLPTGATGARIVSRATAPSVLCPWLDDRRTLGVSLEKLVLRGAEDTIEISVDDAALSDGWWAVESAAGQTYRWTSGNALLALPSFRGNAMLELHVKGTGVYAVEPGEAAKAEHKVA